MKRFTVLIVEDDENINTMLQEYLTKYGYHTQAAYDGEEALAAFSRYRPDIIVLDLMLPKLDGIELCRRIRQISKVPILMLSALGDESDKLIGLEIGADDYITKPFSPKEVAVRLKTILRRCSPTMISEDRKEPKIYYGLLMIDREACVVKVNQSDIFLTATEFKILEVLVEHPERVLSRAQISEKAQGSYFEGYERTIDAHIKNIRQKMTAVAPNIQYIHTVRGLGYKLSKRAD